MSSTSPIATHGLVYLNRAAAREAMPPVIEPIDPVDATYRAMARGRVEMPPKPGVHPRPDAFIHAMPAYLHDSDVAAVKWVSGYPQTPCGDCRTSMA